MYQGNRKSRERIWRWPRCSCCRRSPPPRPVPAPAFQLSGRGGKTIDLSQFKGQVVMINFWATWCGPCRQEMPLLEDIYKKYKPMGFTMLGVNVEPKTGDPEGWLSKLPKPVTFPVAFDVDSKVSKLYKVAGMPTHGVHRPQGQRARSPQGLQARRRGLLSHADPVDVEGIGEEIMRIRGLLVVSWPSPSSVGGLQLDRAVGEAVRSRESRRSDHVVHARADLAGVPRSRVRIARRIARRHRRRRRRLRL